MATEQTTTQFDRIAADATGAPLPGQQTEEEPSRDAAIQADDFMEAFSGTLGESLLPVITWEKTDAMLYFQFFQMVLLFLIWREMRGR